VKKLDIERILTEDKALLEGHFVLRSLLHSRTYLQCARVFEHPGHAEMIAKALAAMLKGTKVDVVVGPAIGGIVVAYELARALGCRAIFAERENDVFHLRRGFEISRGESVVIAEDVITTGGAAQQVVDLVASQGGKTVAVASLANRSGRNPFSVPFHYLYEFNPPNYDASECPLCKEGIPIVKPGSRAEVKR
jgi:orotate phosphoribosyltransferase